MGTIDNTGLGMSGVGTTVAVAETLNDVSSTFNDKNITYNGSLANLDIDTILRAKQDHINDIYQLGDYYVDADELVGGAIKQVYIPFSITDGYYLRGGNSKTRAKYEEWFKYIHLNEKLESWFYQYYLFANVYFSLMDDSDLVTQPPHLCRISNVKINGNPLVEFNARSIKQDLKRQGQKALKKFIDDEQLDVRLSGYPKEVTEALVGNREYVQLDPKTTLLLQGPKPEWQRYAMPMIIGALKPLAKKTLIAEWETALLNQAKASFVHASVGAPKDNTRVADTNILNAVMQITKAAMKAGSGISVTNDWVTYEVIQPDVDKLFDNDKFANCNEEILGAFGINNSVTSGSDASISFGSSQISTKLVSIRISSARRAMSEMMNRVMRMINGSPYGLPRTADEKIPEFVMPICDLTKVAAFQEACMKLWETGNVSRQTLMDAYNLDVDKEFELRKKEHEAGYDDVFLKPGQSSSNNADSDDNDENTTIGRPRMEDSDRASDPGNAQTGRQEKPSNPDGSEAQDE